MKRISVQQFKSRHSVKLVASVVAVVFASLIAFSAYHVAYAQKIIPGVYIGKLKVGGLDFDTAYDLVNKTFSESGDSIVLRVDEYSIEINPQDFGLKYDWYLTVKRAFEVGRSGSFLSDVKTKISGFLIPLHINTFYTIDDELLSQKMSQLKDEVTTPSKNAGFDLIENKVVITPAVYGKDLSSSDIYKMVIRSLDNLDYGEKYLFLNENPPEILEDDLQPMLSNIQSLVEQKFFVQYEGENIELSKKEQASLVTVGKSRGKIDLKLDSVAFEEFLLGLKLKIDTPPRGRVNEVRNGRVLDFEIVEAGKSLDEERFASDFEYAFFNRVDGLGSVEAFVTETEIPENEAEYGIYALLGEGNSKFVGSASGRIHNLTLAAERASGALVPPGKVFSLSEAIGEISAETGYDSAYIITNGRTVLGEGGGVCQTSTTLFRAILNAGLPVVTRHAHAYRVGYYEQDSKPGFDAAIFQPTVDLRFKNDTPNYLLIQSSWDLDAKALTFKIFGTPDGRSVEISDPVITNQAPPPEPLYQDDPTLPKGTVKQVDFAAWGANVIFTRKVMKDGEVLYDDTFKSNYRPWQAIYLKGTKE